MLAQFEKNYQAATPFDLNAANPNYVGNDLAQGANIPAYMFAPNYRTPRSLQMNVGVQREITSGMVLSVDYLRNVTTQLLLGEDLNHTGDVRYLNKTGALSAIAQTNNAFGCGTGTNSASIDCAIAAGATISDYAGAGLDSQNDIGGNCGNAGGCAFGGLNPATPAVGMLVPAGRSVYNALDIKLTHQTKHLLPGIRSFNGTFSYSLSSFKNCGGNAPTSPGASDQDFVINAIDNAHPCAFMGDSLLDRRHQISYGFVADVPGNFRFSIISHFDSPLATSMVVGGSGTAAIFQTDFTGDGTTQDILPGTNVGAFDRSVTPGNENNVINNYNANVAGHLTPAGQALVNAGLFTQAELVSLGAVAPQVAPAPNGQVGSDWLRVFDFKLSWIGKHSFGDHVVEFEPSVGIFNVFNFANFDLPPNTLSGLLTQCSTTPCTSINTGGTINSTDYLNQVGQRVGTGTGVFSEGAPRTFEFGLRISF